MTRSTGHLCSVIGITAALAWAGLAGADDSHAKLHCRSVSGGATTGAPPGQHFTVRVDFERPSPVQFNSALFRLVLTGEGVAINDYEWDLPFTTGGVGDFSLLGLQLPAVITPSSLEGPTYPIDVIDVEFGNFLFAGTHGTGTVLEIDCIMPPSAQPGDEFFVVAAPDTFANGFVEIPTDAGTVLAVRTTNSPDYNGDNVVNQFDLALLLGAWSTPQGDLDGDGDTNAADLAVLLGAWG